MEWLEHKVCVYLFKKVPDCVTKCFWFSIPDPLNLHMNFRISFSVSVKKPGGILIELASNLQISLGNFAILATLNLLVHEHRCFYVY